MGKVKGNVADIQRMSVHDGPGIRTTVFLKGCNMRCAWCHNPETVKMQPEYVVNPKLCIHCGYCEQGCYSGARRLCGRAMTKDEVMEQVLLDAPYYGSDGGVTISGGEPFMQTDFTVTLCRAAKQAGLHVGLETNLSLPRTLWEQAVPYADLFMVDIKCISDDLHQKYTGISNRHILENIRTLDDLGAKLIIRTPAVPGVNACEEEIWQIGEFASRLKNLLYYELLPYHPLGLSKTVEDSGFVRRFPLPDKKQLKQILERMDKKLNMELRFANIKIGAQ